MFIVSLNVHETKVDTWYQNPAILCVKQIFQVHCCTVFSCHSVRISKGNTINYNQTYSVFCLTNTLLKHGVYRESVGIVSAEKVSVTGVSV